MKIPVECAILEPGARCNDLPRLIFSGGEWDEWDVQFCIHGIKLRWLCDHCESDIAKAKE
jgi:hypothetical protein